MNKRILSFIMVMVMVCAMAAGCGKKEEATEKKEEPKQEETKKDDAEQVADEKAEEPAATEAKDTNKTKLDDADIEALKASIADSIKKEYLEPNKIAAEDFKWIDSHSAGWQYFGELKTKYVTEKFMGMEMEIETIPVSPDKEIVDAIFNGLIIWYENSGIDNYEYFNDACIVLTEDVIISIDVAAAK